jgi:hypothetical protein
VLRISTEMKWPSADLLQAPKGKLARVDVPPPLASAATHKAMTRLRAPIEYDDSRVAYCQMLDSMMSAKSCSSSPSSDSSKSESVLASPPPVLDMLICVEPQDIAETPEVEASQQIMLVEVEAHGVSPIGELSCFLYIL